MVGIIWVIKKIRYLIEAVIIKIIVIYINYSVVIDIVRQNNINITFIEKFNLRLIRVLKYLQRFRIELKHKFGKVNIILDVLSRLINRFSDRFKTDSFLILNVVDSFSINVITVNEIFRNRVIKGYQNKSRWIKIVVIVKINTELEKNVVRLSYKFINDLLYFDDPKRGIRLCVSIKTLEHEIFKLIYNEMEYSGYARIYEKLIRGFYIFNIFIKFHEYLRYCSYCQLYQILKHKFYGSL